jgi:hypothetical protein
MTGLFGTWWVGGLWTSEMYTMSCRGILKERKHLNNLAWVSLTLKLLLEVPVSVMDCNILTKTGTSGGII